MCEGWYPKVDSTNTSVLASSSPTYPVHLTLNINIKLQRSSMGSFRLIAGNLHLHRYYDFTEFLVETAPKSLRLSCGSELT